MNHNTIAPLHNVVLFNELVDRVMSRPAHLPGLATFHGFSGYGKTYSAVYAANVHQAFYIECGYSWTANKLCNAILSELGVQPKGTITDKVDLIIEALVQSGRLLIIDEFDHIVNKKFVDLVREIHDKSGAPIIMIGEELLPAKLKEWERFHNRILDFVPAEAATEKDILHLSKLYCPDVDISEDLIKHITQLSAGRVRRACVSFQNIMEIAKSSGKDHVTKDMVPEHRLFTGLPPQRRAA